MVGVHEAVRVDLVGQWDVCKRFAVQGREFRRSGHGVGEEGLDVGRPGRREPDTQRESMPRSTCPG